MLTNKTEDRIILALDTPTTERASDILDLLGERISHVKVGYRLFFLGGISFVSGLIKSGYKVFLDLKLHDIPNTVAIAVQPLLDLGLWSLTLHSAGGRAMLEAAVREKERAGSSTELFGVTILTSHSPESWIEVNPGSPFEETLTARAKLCEDSGLDGLVCSPSDLAFLRNDVREDFLKIVPGIRLETTEDDQTRAKTPEEAIRRGASYLVIGRPVLNAEDPVQVMETIKRMLGD